MILKLLIPNENSLMPKGLQNYYLFTDKQIFKPLIVVVHRDLFQKKCEHPKIAPQIRIKRT